MLTSTPGHLKERCTRSGLADFEVSRPQVCFVRRANYIRCELAKESLIGFTPKLDFSRNKAAEFDDLSTMFVGCFAALHFVPEIEQDEAALPEGSRQPEYVLQQLSGVEAFESLGDGKAFRRRTTRRQRVPCLRMLKIGWA